MFSIRSTSARKSGSANLPSNSDIPNYVALSEDYREVNLKDLIARTQVFLKKSDATYKSLLATEVQEVMGFPVEKFKRSDIGYFSSVPAYNNYFPPSS